MIGAGCRKLASNHFVGELVFVEILESIKISDMEKVFLLIVGFGDRIFFKVEFEFVFLGSLGNKVGNTGLRRDRVEHRIR